MQSAVALALLSLCLSAGPAAAASPAPLTLWGTGSYLTGGSSDKAVSTVSALEELFAGMAGLAGHHTGALDGLLDAAALAQQRPETVVVVAAAALPTHQSPAAVQEKLQELAGAAPAALRLPNAENLGESHPVFAALRRSASKLRVRVLGDCGGSYVPAALPATAAALRTALAAPRDAAAPATRVVVMCLPAAGEDEAAAAASEAALLAEVAAAVGQASPASHLLVHTQRPASAGETESARRRLLAADSSAPAEGGKVAVGADRANQTSNYTNCDPVCHKHVVWMQGLIVAVVILLALAVGCCCMHAVDTPSRYAQPEAARREHAD